MRIRIVELHRHVLVLGLDESDWIWPVNHRYRTEDCGALWPPRLRVSELLRDRVVGNREHFMLLIIPKDQTIVGVVKTESALLLLVVAKHAALIFRFDGLRRSRGLRDVVGA